MDTDLFTLEIYLKWALLHCLGLKPIIGSGAKVMPS